MTWDKTIGWVGVLGLCAACNTSDAVLGDGPGSDDGSAGTESGSRADATTGNGQGNSGAEATATDATVTDATTGTTPPPNGTAQATPATDAEAAAPTIVGTWQGFVEVFTYPDGQDGITLSFVQNSDGTYSGTVTFGNLNQPAPATDPNVGYPPSVTEDATGVVDLAPAFEGFPYTARSITLDGTRLRFGIARYELWNSWCALQTPVPFVSPYGGTPPPVSCAPFGYQSPGGCFDAFTDAGAAPDGGSIDCVKQALCTTDFVCACTAASCAYTPTVDILFDVLLNGDALDGSSAKVTSPDFLYSSATVHFTRSPSP